MALTVTERQSKIQIIEKWKHSGLSQKDFYQQQNIPAHVFYYWHKCYRNQQQQNMTNPSGGFIQLTASTSAGNIELHLPGGARVVFNGPVSSDFLKALIS